MNKNTKQLIGILFLFVFLTGCIGSGQGPLVWIDQPLNNSIVPLGPVTIQAHASDQDGVTGFEFYVNGELVSSVDASGDTLEDASFEWTPQEPGEYKIEVRAYNQNDFSSPFVVARVSTGEIGTPPSVSGANPTLPVADTYALITNVTCGPGQVVLVDIAIAHPVGILGFGVVSDWSGVEYDEDLTGSIPKALTKQIELAEPGVDTVDRQHTITLVVEVDGNPSLLYATATEPNGRCPGHFDDSVVELGELPETVPLAKATTNANCRSGPDTLYPVIANLNQGQEAPIVGKNSLGTWWVLDPGLGGKYCWISGSIVEVIGEVDTVAIIVPPPLPVTSTPTQAPFLPTSTWTPLPVIEADLTLPVFSYYSASPDEILTEGGGCASYPRITNVTADVTDNKGIDYVVAFWYLGGNSGQVTLSHAGGSTYEGSIGPVNTTGTMEIYIYAYDDAGNVASVGPINVTVNNCIG